MVFLRQNVFIGLAPDFAESTQDRLQDKKQRVCVTATWRAKMCDAKGLLFKRLKWSLSYKTHSVLQ